MDVNAVASPNARPVGGVSAGAAPAAEAGAAKAGYRVESLDRLMAEAVGRSRETSETPAERPPQKLKVTLDIDRNTNRVVAALVDPDTGEIKQELPPEELLRSAAQLREMIDRILDIEV
jgi:hypothetical protein